MPQAKGTFEVKVTPLPMEDAAQRASLARMSLEKTLSGDLEATGAGQMMASGSPNGSRAYVALERITGTLHGRKGSFALQHSGSMTEGQAHVNITVVPGSGTEELVGISGEFVIQIVEGKHSYSFEYAIPDARADREARNGI
jgi:hypothetical protein